MRMYLIPLFLCLSSLNTGCSLTKEVASALIKDPPEANLDVGAAVQVGKTNVNNKTSTVTKDRRLVTNVMETKTTAEELNQSWSVPWWALLMAVLAGILVDPLTMYERFRHIKR